jgi:hypothetical protein
VAHSHITFSSPTIGRYRFVRRIPHLTFPRRKRPRVHIASPTQQWILKISCMHLIWQNEWDVPRAERFVKCASHVFAREDMCVRAFTLFAYMRLILLITKWVSERTWNFLCAVDRRCLISTSSRVSVLGRMNQWFVLKLPRRKSRQCVTEKSIHTQFHIFLFPLWIYAANVFVWWKCHIYHAFAG